MFTLAIHERQGNKSPNQKGINRSHCVPDEASHAYLDMDK